MTRSKGAASLCSALLLFLYTLLVAGQGSPEHSITSFNYLPARLFFFDDTEAAVYHDSMEGNLYVSHDEGKSWKRAEGIPEGKVSMVIEHPVDNRYAFALTDDTTHYRTEDRGKTWRPFEVPLPPALVARPFSFHSDPTKYGYILYHGTRCERKGIWNVVCHDETFYTKEAFSDTPQTLMKDTSRCQFAHSSKDFKHEAHEDLVYCVAYSTSSSSGTHDLSSSRLFSSTDFFQSQSSTKVEDLGIGKNARGVVALAIVSKFAVVALKDLSPNSVGEMLLYVTVDTKTWAKAHFPHASSAKLRENAYTILESTTHSLAVDVLLQDRSTIGTLFVSNSNGTYFVESLKDTNRNDLGFVDYERIYGVEGIGMANFVSNSQDVEGKGSLKRLRTVITYDDGSSWAPIKPPTVGADGSKISCNPSDPDTCSLHLHSVTTPHNYGRIFSSPAPGFVMGVGNVGENLNTYEESDTFLSTDAGISWTMVSNGAHKYEFGDLGSILVTADDEDSSTEISYSLDLGKNWRKYDFGLKVKTKGLLTLPDSTSQKFLLLGQVRKADQKEHGPVVVIYLDFSKTRGQKCVDSDYENWYARPGHSDCLMGHKQWYKRRKPTANCYVGEKYKDPVVHEDNCECTDADYECDYNFVKVNDKCEPVGPEPIPAGVCVSGPDQTYKGSSGYRKIPGNTCEGGVKKDGKVDKKCSQAQPAEGNVIHQTFKFKSLIVQHAYFKDSQTILVRLNDKTVWQSNNEGYSWNQLFPDKRFLVFYHHKYSSDRAYLITETDNFYYTTDTGSTWNIAHAPTPPNTFGAQVLRFHPKSDYILWTGDKDCSGNGANCRAETMYSLDNGRNWKMVDHYVRNCAYAKDSQIDADPTEILCESFKDKKGSQRYFGLNNPMELVVGTNFYQSNRRKLFDWVVGFAKFSEFLVVAEMVPQKHSLELEVSLDGKHFALGQFPPSMHPETHAYTILESSTKSLFLHMTVSEPPAPYWGAILKSNSNGTYFGVALEHVNRNERGYVDFEKLVGLDGIAIVNVVSNPEEAKVSGKKDLQTRITHNDGSTWTPLSPPVLDSLGNPYECKETCQLNIHGYTERIDPRASYSSPSVPGLVMGVGNVGESLARYSDSDTFLSRNGGFTWQEVHKDAHLWEFGDSGSILILANDEQPTDFVLYTVDEGISWREYKFTEEKMRVRSIVTVPADTSRRFILMGEIAGVAGSVVVHLDFTALTSRECTVNVENPGHDDFELWSPSEDRPEQCLFGRQTLYHRRVRDANCKVGELPKAADRIVELCPCAQVDFECEFNHVKNANDECELVPGTTPLPDDDSCQNGEDFWYERTPYRLIPYSSCVEGYRPDRGKAHVCPGLRSKSGWFWFFVLLIPFIFAALVGYYYYRKSGMSRGHIRLPGDMRTSSHGGDTGVVATLASVPWFIIGVAGIAYEWVASRVDRHLLGSRRGYRNVPIDEDAQILRFDDEE